jgi:Domain of unknown function (DUF1906)
MSSSSKVGLKRPLVTCLVAMLVLVASTTSSSGSVTATQGTVYTGYGFDTCRAPSLPALTAWLSSPYRALGIYVGGLNRACPDGNLSAAWVATATAAGWSLAPLYVGRQAPCVSQPGLARIDAASAGAEGLAAADDAVARAAAFGLVGGTPIYFDMEGYSTTDTACTQVVQAFLSAWTAELHARGYVAGVYGSAASTIRDLAALAAVPGATPPDDVWIANWNGTAAVFGDPYVPDSVWTNHQRLHQYQGGHNETYGGVTLNIDSNYLDGAVVAASGVAAQPPPPPPPPPSRTSTAGSVSSGDGRASVTWPATAFPAPATVTLGPSTLVRSPQGVGSGVYIVQLGASDAANGAPISRFAAPLALHLFPASRTTLPFFSTDGQTWTPLPRTQTASLAVGADSAYAVEPDGTLSVSTLVPGLFGLFPDSQPPTPPAALAGRFVRGKLLLRWQASTDNSGSVAGYQVTLGGTPLLTVPGTTRQAAVATFNPSTPTVYRLVAVDAAGNKSSPSPALVVVPNRRPADAPRAIPAWVSKLLAWQQSGNAGARPVTPKPLPAWYWHWAAWRSSPFHVRANAGNR